MVQDQNPPLIDGLTEDEIMAIYQDGELAGMEGRSVLVSPFLDHPQLLSIWIQGYMDQPIDEIAAPDQHSA
ncbi:hypothetical protein KX729_13190 [Rhizobium sp. XQZ8]|jgi:hypothetical protein|uniref:hypothetical protein n=1 Tax=Rhizobium populisoli TaxID=2859785 RepID=UPI001CA5BC71|nr:hypothetical protein [Rhizobium populisoli]MBW6422405.1 hypothetical protein [Rhizobium populisoli]